MKRVFLASLLLGILFPCSAQVKSNKAAGYDKKINEELTVYITLDEDKQRSEWSAGIKEKLTAEFAARNIKADVTVYTYSAEKNLEVLQAYEKNTIDADSLRAYLNPEFVTTNINGLILVISETLISESIKGRYSESEFTLSLMDTTVDKTVWKAKINVIFKGNIGGTANSVKSAIAQIMKALRKDELL